MAGEKNPTATYRTTCDSLLREQFQHFMEDASPEEKRLLYDILQCRERAYHHGQRAAEACEIPIAGAFFDAIEWDTSHMFKVPDEHEENVRGYIKWLLSQDAEQSELPA